MPKISSYPKDTNVTDNDAWIGTDSLNKTTKQFTAKDVASYLNLNAKIEIGGQMFYNFSTIASPRATGTISFTAGGGDYTAFSAINSLKVAAKDIGGQTVNDFMAYLVNSNILITQQDALSNFGHYTITSWGASSESNFYDLGLNYIGGNGSITETVYAMLQFDTSSTGASAETWTQSSSAATWNVTHSLHKKPSVTVVIGDPTNYTVIIPEIVYGDGTGNDLDSKLQVKLSAANKGYAYLN